MKKIMLSMFAVLVLAIGSAQATTISGDVGSMINQPSKQYTRMFDIRIQQESLGIQLTETGTINRIETDYNIIPLQSVKFISVDAGAGVVTGSTIGHYTYSVEPKVTLPVGADVTLFGGYKFRNSIVKTVRDETRTATVGASYKLTQSVALIAKIEDSKGDYKYKQASIGAQYSF